MLLLVLKGIVVRGEEDENGETSEDVCVKCINVYMLVRVRV